MNTVGRFKPDLTSYLAARRRAGALLIALMAALLVFTLDRSGGLTDWENRAYDRLFYFKAGLWPSRVDPAVPVVLVEIDDTTLAEDPFLVPRILWYKHMATVVQCLADAGAKVIGLDYLLAKIEFRDLAADYRRTWLKALAYCRHRGSPVIIGGYYLRNRLIMPDQVYLQINGPDYFGLFNLTTDPDDFCRRQRLYYPPAGEGGQGLYAFSSVVARIYDPDLPVRTGEIYIDFKSDPGFFPRYPFARVYRESAAGNLSFLEKHFRGRIVLIGETHSHTQDRHPTPLYHIARAGPRRTSGVEIQANIVHTLLKQRFFRPAAPWMRLAAYLFLALVICFYTVFGPVRLLPLFAPGLILLFGAVCLAVFSFYFIPPFAGGLAAILAALAGSFSYRYWVVDRERKRVEAISAEMKYKLELARQIQTSLLPRSDPEIQGLDVAGAGIYCDETGGDYYDYLQVAPESPEDRPRLAVVVADVSDHGVPSALMMTTARAFLRQRRTMPGSPAEVITDLNQQISRDVEDSGQFITMFYSEIDPESKRITWVIAGHDPAILYDPQQDGFDDLAGRGLALGLLEDFTYRSSERELTGGQVIVITTDGVWEARNEDGESFGREHLRESIRELALRPAREILEGILKAMKRFGVAIAREDDVTLVVVKVQWPSGPR